MSSAQLYPTRVDPIMRGGGLEQVPVRPDLLSFRSKKLCAVRNLFDSGDRDRDETDRLFWQENEKSRRYVQQRYEVAAAPITADLKTRNASPHNLIVLERLHAELKSFASEEAKEAEAEKRCSERRIQEKAEVTPPPPQQLRRIALSSLARGAGAAVDGDIDGASERPKPYARQTLLTESFGVRKSSQLHKAAAAATRRPVEVLEMPQPIRARAFLEIAPAAEAAPVVVVEAAEEPENAAETPAAPTTTTTTLTTTTSADSVERAEATAAPSFAADETCREAAPGVRGSREVVPQQA